MKHYVKRLVALILLVAVLAPGIVEYNGVSYTVYGDLQSELDDAKAEKDRIEKEMEALKDKLTDIRNQYSSVDEYLKQLDAQMTQILSQIGELDEEITGIENEISDLEEKLTLAQQEADKQYELMKLRIKFMYERNDETYIQLILEAKSLAEALNKAEYVSKMSEYDRKMLEEYQKTVDYIAQTKGEIEDEREILLAKRESLEAQQSQVQSVQEEKNKELEALHALAVETEKLENEACHNYDEIDKIIAAKEKEIAEKYKEEELPPVSGSGMCWPTKSKRITSDYGETEDRVVPHRGIDIGAVVPGTWGDPIYAAESGVVVTAEWDSDGGNWLWIYHGNDLYTVYMHCGSFKVAEGTKVVKGQTIATMGSTGNSTGPHLHFAVRVNGDYVNPWNYVSK